MAWSRRYDIAGRVIAEWNGAGAVFEGVPGVTDPTDIEAPTAGQGLAADKRYIYDFAGRLTRVDDRTAADTGITLDNDTNDDPQAPCTRREYAFDKNGNRTKFKTSSTGSGDCFWVSVDTDTTHTYDGYDRPLKASDGTDYVYDAFGRQTLIPAADAPETTLGDIGLSYFDDDLAHSITQDNTTTTFGLDPAGRRLTQSTVSSTGTTSLLRHYGDDTDNPAWATTQDGYLMRFTPSLDGLGAIIDADGNVNMPLANPHGDNVTTVMIPEAQAATVPVTQIGGWADYTEYGVSKTGQTRGWGYGWLGSHERATQPETAGLTLMGSRLYNPVRGAFTSIDPVPGGNTTAFTYPQDPINNFDLDGQSKASKAWKNLKKRFKSVKWKQLGKKLLKSGIARGVLTSAAIAAICVASAGIGCAVIAGAVVGGGLAAANYRVNTKKRSKSGYAKSIGKGAAWGAVNGIGGFARGGAVKKYAEKNRHTWNPGKRRVVKQKSYSSWGHTARSFWKYRAR